MLISPKCSLPMTKRLFVMAITMDISCHFIRSAASWPIESNLMWRSKSQRWRPGFWLEQADLHHFLTSRTLKSEIPQIDETSLEEPSLIPWWSASHTRATSESSGGLSKSQMAGSHPRSLLLSKAGVKGWNPCFQQVPRCCSRCRSRDHTLRSLALLRSLQS